MLASTEFRVSVQNSQLTHDDVSRIAAMFVREQVSPIIVVDLSAVEDATTSALAGLVLLRRALLHSGQDLRLDGLHGRAAGIYEICRLAVALPRHEHGRTAGARNDLPAIARALTARGV